MRFTIGCRSPRPGAMLWLTVVMLAAGGSGSTRAEESHGPLTALQDARCSLPPGLKGVTGHALVQYYVGADGSVSFIETTYAVTRPASQRTAFMLALESCVKGWRYQPRKESLAGANRLLMAFHYLEPAPADAPFVAVGNGQTMPLEHFEEIRREKLNLAAGLLAGPDYAEMTGDGWTLRTDAPRRDLDAVAAALRFAGRAFETMFPGAVPRDDGPRATVLYFSQDEALRKVAAFDNMIRMHFAIAGQYNPREQIIYTSAQGHPDIAAMVLMHEVTHHFIHQRLYQGAREPALWVSEGIATFVESLRRARGDRVDLSAIDTESRSKGQWTYHPHAAVYLRLLRAASKAGKLPGLAAECLDLKPGQRMNVETVYAVSWLLWRMGLTH